MTFGAARKGASWKFGAWLAGGGVLLALFVAGAGQGGDAVLAFFAFLALGFVFSLPYGLSPKPREAGGPGFRLALPPYLFLITLFYLVGFRVMIWAGDLLLTTIWKLLRAIRSVKAAGAEVE
jgi:hypothetical protein